MERLLKFLLEAWKKKLKILTFADLSFAKQYVISTERLYNKYPTNTPDAKISASAFLSSFKFQVPPTPKNCPPKPVLYRIKMIIVKIWNFLSNLGYEKFNGEKDCENFFYFVLTILNTLTVIDPIIGPGAIFERKFHVKKNDTIAHSDRFRRGMFRV